MPTATGAQLGVASTVTTPSPAASPEFDALLSLRAVTAVFQPVVDLATSEVVGLEALARGPAASSYASPAALFAEARRCGRTAELDWVCRAAAFRAVLDAGLPSSLSVFINTEPESLAAPCPADLVPVVARAESLLRVFVEINDRAIVADPAGLLAAVDRARTLGWGIAVDDVGSSRAPLAMLPVLRADVVKLDLRLLADRNPGDAAAVALATLRHVEQTGASLCVERIETEDDLRWAVALGARYGQGTLLGAPGPIADAYPALRAPVPLVAGSPVDAPGASPLGLLSEAPLRRVDREQFRSLARAMAFGSLAVGAAPVVLSGYATGFLPEVAATFPQGVDALVNVVFAPGIDPEPAPGVRGVRLLPSDPLTAEPFLVVLTEHGVFAVLAHLAGPDAVDVLLTQEPEVVHAVARHLIRRIPPPGGDGVALPPGVADGPDQAGGADEAPARGSAATADPVREPPHDRGGVFGFGRRR